MLISLLKLYKPKTIKLLIEIFIIKIQLEIV